MTLYMLVRKTIYQVNPHVTVLAPQTSVLTNALQSGTLRLTGGRGGNPNLYLLSSASTPIPGLSSDRDEALLVSCTIVEVESY